VPCSVFAQSAQDKSIKAIEKTIDWIAVAVNESRLENWVKDMYAKTSTFPRRNARTDYIFRAIVDKQTNKSVIINGLAGLVPDAVEIPAKAGQIAMDWAAQAQAAYTVSYLYKGVRLKRSDLKIDLYMLLAGDDIVKEAAKAFKPSLTPAQLDEVGRLSFLKYFTNAELTALCEKIAEKIYSKKEEVAKAFVVDKVVGEIIGKPLSAFKDAFVASFKMEDYVKRVQRYYWNFPNPEGMYANLFTGVALYFDKTGQVRVHPRLDGANKSNGLDIKQSTSLGSGTYTVDKNTGKITMTFGKVSWKESQWNAPRPTNPPNDKPNYVPVESTLSNKKLKGRITGYESINLTGYFNSQGDNDWMLVVYQTKLDEWRVGHDVRP